MARKGGQLVGILDVHILQAERLPNRSTLGAQDVYAKVLCGDRDPLGRVALTTRAIKGGGTDPVFDQRLQVGIPERATEGVRDPAKMDLIQALRDVAEVDRLVGSSSSKRLRSRSGPLRMGDAESAGLAAESAGPVAESAATAGSAGSDTSSAVEAVTAGGGAASASAGSGPEPAGPGQRRLRYRARSGPLHGSAGGSGGRGAGRTGGSGRLMSSSGELYKEAKGTEGDNRQESWTGELGKRIGGFGEWTGEGMGEKIGEGMGERIGEGMGERIGEGMGERIGEGMGERIGVTGGWSGGSGRGSTELSTPSPPFPLVQPGQH
ncbi:unnamed protein product [Closterium sp. Naga37s-1]|nr:unnamed protein product [Closterium sp. Naga37s-1]